MNGSHAAVRRLAIVLITVMGSSASGCGDSESPAQDAAIDADAAVVRHDAAVTDSPYLAEKWRAEISDEVLKVEDAVMLPTGIAVLAPPHIFLVDKQDGSLIAQAPYPMTEGILPAYFRGALARSSGNLALLASQSLDDRGRHEVIYEYASDDLSLVQKTEIAPTSVSVAVAELNGELYAWQRTDEQEILLHRLAADGAVDSQTALRGDSSVSPGVGVATPDEHLLFCNRRLEGPAEPVRVDPQTASAQTLELPGDSSHLCALVPAADRVLAHWRDHDGRAHWDILAPNGDSVLARSSTDEFFPFIDSRTYVDGTFVLILRTRATTRIEVWAVDAETAEVRGPYRVRVPRATLPETPAVASDGASLFVIYATSDFGLRVFELGRLPD